jgi:hypothetical protein
VVRQPIANGEVESSVESTSSISDRLSKAAPSAPHQGWQYPVRYRTNVDLR